MIIPVKNRSRPLAMPSDSVLIPESDFDFNLIIVDNHSTDGTGEIIRSFCQKRHVLIHIIPERNDLGIGGCWNEAVFHPACGKFAVQLDSDDLYIDDTGIITDSSCFLSAELCHAGRFIPDGQFQPGRNTSGTD